MLQVERANILNTVERCRRANYQYRDEKHKQIQGTIEQRLKSEQDENKQHGQEHKY